ncbi:MAG: hypothetical protein HY540_03070 [Deltaproteobacteria bacterium]|nr:hypothetical protein [Deltaproteobacteria bacterium]
MAKIRICKEKICKDQATTEGYCRLHFLKHWKTIRDDKKKKAAKKLNAYVDYMLRSNPDNVVEAIRSNIQKGEFKDQPTPDAADEPTFIFEDAGAQDEIRTLLKELKIGKEY